MFDPRLIYHSSLTMAVGGQSETNIVDSRSPYRGPNQLPAKARIPRFRGSAFPIICGTGADTVYSSPPQCGSKEPVSVPRCYASIFYCADRLERPKCGSRSRTRLISGDIRDSRVCLRHHTTDWACRSISYTWYVYVISLMGKGII